MSLLKLLDLLRLSGGRRLEDSDSEPIRYGRVVPDGSRCIQCGMCGYNCPVGIPVRDYARQGLIVDDPACITCGQCINVCPRGTLRWETDTHPIVVDLFAGRMGYACLGEEQ